MAAWEPTQHPWWLRAIVALAITALADGLGLPITAEGIESAEALEELKRLGSYQGQGPIYGCPQPADLTRERLAQLGLLPETEKVEADMDAALHRSNFLAR